MIHQIGLFIHILGIFLIAGGNVGSFVAERQLWKNMAEPEGAKRILPMLLIFPPIIIVGALLMLLSGLIMLYSVDWGFAGQSWFAVKIVIFITLVLNGRLAIKRTLIEITARTLAGDYESVTGRLRRKLNRLHVIQYSLLLILLGVTVFRF
ncbi:hypothetical protein WSM22_36350 [Cytophagales bacterium WSM2-2]|nr:hypothetical protein WSM22_36350 [Cytophagales bacterium WSM2-2]